MNTPIDEMSRAAGALVYINPDCVRPLWIKLLMAVKSEFGEAGRIIAEEWSARADSYNKTDFKAVWNSCNEGGNVTTATLFYEAKQHGYPRARGTHYCLESGRYSRPDSGCLIGGLP